MKIKIDVECTPEEARSFLGLPDVRPMQDAMMQHAQQRMEEAMAAMDPESLWRTWMGTGMPPGMQEFWSRFTQGGKGGSGKGR
jgi:hypothetical protein